MAGAQEKLRFEIPVFKVTFVTAQFQDVANHGQKACTTWIDYPPALSAWNANSLIGKRIGAQHNECPFE
jgi:hypothetical protein